jgi:hypothetical protein
MDRGLSFARIDRRGAMSKLDLAIRGGTVVTASDTFRAGSLRLKIIN